jgi:DNA polymerase I
VARGQPGFRPLPDETDRPVGRKECHEAINAVAREILLDSKATLEAHGWRVVHGIVDSLWVQRADAGADAEAGEDAEADANPTPIADVCDRISDDVGIRLEHEGAFEWVCFVPLRGAEKAGALTKYFGKRDDGGYKFRGVEARQRSTPAYVVDCQRAFVETLDETRSAGPVVEQCKRFLGELHSGTVDPDDFVIRKQASKALGEYSQETFTVGALRRYADHGIERAPGDDVAFVVVDDASRVDQRVRLDFEDTSGYDPDFYAELLVRACESVVSPLGMDGGRRHRGGHSGDQGRVARRLRVTNELGRGV